MKSFLFLFIFFTSYVFAQEPDSSSALFSMREAERNFAKASLMIGRNAAFAEYFADESLVFTNKWISNGKQFSKESKPNPIVLKWEPEFMDISDSHDFGYSTGPWEVQEYRPNTAPLFTGYFLTVWKKQVNGEWKVILDGGSTTPVVRPANLKFSFIPGADKPVTNPPVIKVDQSKKELLERDATLQQSLKKDPAVFSTFLTSGARLQMNGHLPATDADSLNKWIGKLDRTMIWQTEGSGAATSGDMGFTYGIIKTQQGASGGHYVLIWKRHPGSSWNIVMGMINIE